MYAFKIFSIGFSFNLILNLYAESLFDPQKIPFNCGGQENQNNLRKNSAAGYIKLWTNGIVYYDISPSFNNMQIEMIKRGFEILENATKVNDDYCVQFKPRTNQRNFVRIIDDKGCYSYVGMIGGPQQLSLQIPGCLSLSVVIHEALHALGFNHEHQRPDRDNYIDVFLDNVQDKYKFAFAKLSNRSYFDLKTQYDLKSIMHYASYSGSKNTRYTILAKREPRVIRYNDKLSEIDIDEIRKLYKCTEYSKIKKTTLTTSTLKTKSSLRVSSSRSSTNSLCQNMISDSLCTYFISFCNSNQAFIENMIFYDACKKTCKRCVLNVSSTKVTTKKNCDDSSLNCIFWKNFCNLLIGKNPHPCPKTCGIC